MRVLALASLATSLSMGLVSVPLDAEPLVHVGYARAVRKSAAEPPPTSIEAGATLGTLVGIHTQEHVALGKTDPPLARFAALLADRTTGERAELDPRLLDLLRDVATKTPGARIELVSGYRSLKLNERMRKKGRNVASHSQHSLGHAVDFRVIAEGSDEPMEPAAVEKMVRDLGWVGGVGIYPGKSDRFVHCDVGPNRRWLGK